MNSMQRKNLHSTLIKYKADYDRIGTVYLR